MAHRTRAFINPRMYRNTGGQEEINKLRTINILNTSEVKETMIKQGMGQIITGQEEDTSTSYSRAQSRLFRTRQKGVGHIRCMPLP